MAVLLSIGTALPPLQVAQTDALDFYLQKFTFRPGARALTERLFRHPGVATRHFAVDGLEDFLDQDPDRVNDRFRRGASTLAAQALADALAGAGLKPRDLDFLAVTTCTGYLCPGLSSYVSEALDLKPEAARADLVGMGCAAALPALEAARGFLAVHPGATAAAVCVELGSAAFLHGESADLLISNAIFGDGAAAAVLREKGTGPRLGKSISVHVPAWREEIRFRTEGGRLRNVLASTLPGRAGEAFQGLVDRLLKDRGLSRADIAHWVVHPGGAKILDAVRDTLSLPEEKLAASRAVIKRVGNISSPSCLFVLDEVIRTSAPEPGDLGLLAAFGAGFSAHAALLEF
jgi:alkylresorcinol/alkylpyrone synthase